MLGQLDVGNRKTSDIDLKPQKVKEESSDHKKQANLSFKPNLNSRVSIRNGVIDSTKFLLAHAKKSSVSYKKAKLSLNEIIFKPNKEIDFED